MINVNYVFLPFTCRKEIPFALSGGVGLCSKQVQIILPALVLGNTWNACSRSTASKAILDLGKKAQENQNQKNNKKTQPKQD